MASVTGVRQREAPRTGACDWLNAQRVHLECVLAPAARADTVEAQGPAPGRLWVQPPLQGPRSLPRAEGFIPSALLTDSEPEASPSMQEACMVRV